MANDANDGMAEKSQTWLQATQWSIVLAAGDSESPKQREAMNNLCETYRPAVLAFIQSKGYGREDAEDITQNFFMQLVEKKVLGKVARNRGRFRGFLSTALRNFLANHWDKISSKKSGGQVAFVAITEEKTETHTAVTPSHNETPDKEWDYRWATVLMKQAMDKLKADFVKRGDGALFDALEVYLTDSDGPPYAATAARLGKSEDAVKMDVKRLRERYGNKLRSEIQQTVTSLEDLDDEIRYLLSVLSAGPGQRQT